MQVFREILHDQAAKGAEHPRQRPDCGCLDCKDCVGICPHLIEALTLPDLVLKRAG